DRFDLAIATRPLMGLGSPSRPNRDGFVAHAQPARRSKDQATLHDRRGNRGLVVTLVKSVHSPIAPPSRGVEAGDAVLVTDFNQPRHSPGNMKQTRRGVSVAALASDAPAVFSCCGIDGGETVLAVLLARQDDEPFMNDGGAAEAMSGAVRTEVAPPDLLA